LNPDIRDHNLQGSPAQLLTMAFSQVSRGVRSCQAILCVSRATDKGLLPRWVPRTLLVLVGGWIVFLFIWAAIHSASYLGYRALGLLARSVVARA
jgi:hypothetical protein